VNLAGFFSKRTGDEGEKCSHLAFCLPLFLRKGVWGMIDTQYYGSMNKRRFSEDVFGAIAIARHAFYVVKPFCGVMWLVRRDPARDFACLGSCLVTTSHMCKR